MAEYDDKLDGVGDEQKRFEPISDGTPAEPVDYELTAKDAGWRSPTLFVSRATIVYFDPPRPRKPRET